MSKYNFVAEVARETALRASKSPDDWMLFLRTAANNYKYSFSDQVLIHAQRPKATACATLETWNEKMGCWVNRGAKGIALMDAENGRLNYVFDVSDVHPVRGIGRLPKLWRMGEEHQEAVMERLEQTYGAVDARLPFEDRVMTLAGRIAADYAWDILPDLQLGQEGSYLEDFDEQNLFAVLRETLSASIACEVLNRCGFNVEGISERLDFSHIAYFNTPDTISVLGNAVSEMSKPVLMEIGRAISAYDKEKSRQRKMALGSDLCRFPEQTENISTPDEKTLKKCLQMGRGEAIMLLRK